MTSRTANPLVDVDGVVEIHVIRQIVHLDPGDGIAGRPTIAHRRQQVGIGPDLGVTVDAGLGRRNAGIARFLHRRVAILALQSQALNVVLVAEWDRLLRALALAGDPRGTLQVVERHAHSDQDHSKKNKADPSQRIGTTIKNLRHV